MSHELVIDRAGRAAFCYNQRNGNPWHRLGTSFDRPFTLIEATAMSGLDRSAELTPVWALTNDGFVEIDHRRCVVFPNEDGVLVPLEVVSAEYKLVQHHTLAELALAIVGGSDQDGMLDTLGLLYDGRQSFGFIDFGDVLTTLPNGAVDRTYRGLGFLGSIDASMSSTFYTTRIRAVCNNTVTFGIQSAKNIMRVRHTGDQEEKMRSVRQVLELERHGSDQFESMMMHLGSLRGGDDVLDRVIDRVWPLPAPALLTDRSKAISKNRREKLHRLYRASSNAGGFGDTGWSVLNTVIEFLDHVEGADPGARARQVIDPSRGKHDRKETAVGVLLGV